MQNDDQTKYPDGENPYNPNPQNPYYPYPPDPTTQNFGSGQWGAKLPSPPPQKKNSLNLVIPIVSVIVVVVVIIAALAYTRIINPPITVVPPAPTVLITQVGQQQLSTPSPGTPSPSETTPILSGTTPTQSSMKTITPQNQTLPLVFSCVDCDYPRLTLTLDSITVDPPDRTNWVFSLLNGGHNSCSDISLSSYPGTIKLIDPSGTEYRGEGQASGTFDIAAEQSLQVTAVFDLMPTAGTLYTLKLAIDVDGCSGSYGTNNYQTVNFTFS